MKVIVTGGAGYLGSLLVPELRCHLAEVTVVDWDSIKVPDDCEFICDDVRVWSPEAPADVCIHLAAITGIKECEQDSHQAETINWHAVERALNQWPVEHHIFISTGGVYGRQQGDVTEDTAVAPEGVYTSTKAYAEEAVLNVGGCVLRLNHLTGMASRMRWNEIGNNLARLAARYPSVDIYDPFLYRPYTHVRDAAEIIAKVAMLQPSPPNELFNVAVENRTKKSVGNRLADVTGTTPRYQNKYVDHWDYRVTSERLKKKLGLEPTRTLNEAMNEVIKWERNLADELIADYVDRTI